MRYFKFYPHRRLGRDLSVVTISFLISAFLITGGTAIKCFQCLERPASHEKHLACSYFDRSGPFRTDCEYSTFCLKRTSRLKLANGTEVVIAVHKCADQSQKTVLEDTVTGKWTWGKIIHKFIYNDGCYAHEANFMLTTEVVDCFCSTDYCNAADGSKRDSVSAVFATVLISALWSVYASRV